MRGKIVKSQPIKVILSGGGTAGHIYPALATADELRSRGVELLYVGTATGPEAKLAQQAEIQFSTLTTAGFVRSRPLSLLSSSAKALTGAAQALKLLKKEKPDAVACFGGYVSVPLGLAATLRKIPLIIHEQNSHMGMTNRFLAKRAQSIALTYPETTGMPDKQQLLKREKRVKFVGNPVRESVLKADGEKARKEFGIPADAQLLLVFGGSRGARAINQAMCAIAAHILDAIPNLYILHGTGTLEYDSVNKELDELLFKTHPELKQRYLTLPYIENMGDVLAAADLVVARAGATSIAELTVLGKPSVLIPYPFATDDHQTTNAEALSTLGGARVIANNHLDTKSKEFPVFADTLLELMGSDELLASMAVQAATLGKAAAAQTLADEVMYWTNSSSCS